MVVSFSITDIVGIIDLSRKIWVAFDEGPRGAKDDFASLYTEYGQFVKTFESLQTFFQSQSQCEYDFTALQATLERLKNILNKYGRLRGSVTAGRVIDTVKFPFKKKEIENVRLHLTRHQESLMLYFAQHNLQATNQTRDVAIDINERTEEIYRIVQHLRAQLQSVLLESPRRSIASPDLRITPLMGPLDDLRQGSSATFSPLPSAMMPSTSDDPTQQNEPPEAADIVELPDFSTLTHIDPAEIEAIRKLWRKDSGFVDGSIVSPSLGPVTRTPTYDDFDDEAAANLFVGSATRRPTYDQFLDTRDRSPGSPRMSPKPRSLSRTSSGGSPGESPTLGHSKPVSLSPTTQATPKLAHASPAPNILDMSDSKPEPAFDSFCTNVVMKARDDKHVFCCRSCPSGEQRMTLKHRKRTNGNLKLRLTCSNCDRLVLEHECRLTMPLIPYTFYTGYNDNDALAVFFTTCSEHPIPGKGILTSPKYLFANKDDYIKFQELIYGMNYLNTWNVKEFRTSDGRQWSDETLRLFRDNIEGLTIVFAFVLNGNGGKGHFEAYKAFFENKIERKGKKCKLRLKKREDVPQLSGLTRRSSINTSGGNSMRTWNSGGSSSSTSSVAASCLSFDRPPSSSGCNKQVDWIWIEFTFLTDKDCQRFSELWSQG